METKLFKDTKDLLARDKGKGDHSNKNNEDDGDEEVKVWRGMSTIAKGLEKKIKKDGIVSLFLNEAQKLKK